MLKEGKKGCGFAVGTEPLPSLFAKYGVEVLATDLDKEKSLEGWIDTGQHAADLESLYRPEIIDREVFGKYVSFRTADMRNLNLPWSEQFDFLWSSCSIEHLGGLEPGFDFVEKAMELLKPHGVAVHTTEYNVASNDLTADTGWSVIYRKRDIEDLERRLRRAGFGLARPDFFAGDHPFDLAYDERPFGLPDRHHVKLMLDGHLTTSMMLIIQKS